MALLHFLTGERERCGFFLSAVHCEHGIRGKASLADRRFCEELCERWNIPLYCFSESCPERAKREKVSLETAAREFRYACFQTLFAQGKADFVALAHHADDAAETILFRLARGTSLSGTQGMQERNGRFLRPLLSWTKADIEAYAQKNSLRYCVDETNFEREATRNKLRLDVLPCLAEAVPGATGNLLRFAELAREDDGLLYELSQELLTENGEVRFCEKKPLFRRACLSAMRAVGLEKDYTAKHLDALYALQSSERGARLDLPCDIEAVRRENTLVFRRKKEKLSTPLPKPQKFDESGFDGGRYLVNVSFLPPKENGDEWKTLRLDVDKIPACAVYRFRADGDRIKCFGGAGKSLKKLFNEKKTATEERAYLPLIADADGSEVYAVCGVEISEKVKVTTETRRVLYISIRRKEK